MPARVGKEDLSSRSAIAFPAAGIVYVYETKNVSSKWISVPPAEYTEPLATIQNIPGNERLRLRGLGATLETEVAFYQRHSVYQASRGIATSHLHVNIADALHIFVTKGYLTQQEIASLPEDVRMKIEEY